MKRKISLIFGTRPEAIKLCPLVRALKHTEQFDVNVCATGQHRQMLDQVLRIFEVIPDVDLSLMQPNQTLASLTGRAISAIDEYLAKEQPQLVVVQGDTTTAFCAALAAFYRKIKVAHIEAGLRTGDKFAPFPEEINRVLTSRITDLHFAPTEWSKKNLLKEGIPANQIWVTGNTVIDALHIAAAKVRDVPPPVPGLKSEILDHRSVLITGHRRENFGAGFESICQAINMLAKKFSDVEFIYPVHLNPNVREPVFRILGQLKNVHLIEPLEYLPFVRLMQSCRLILTDSGGVQEEAPSLGKPVLVMRDTTERPEAIEAGTVRLVGTEVEKIISSVTELLESTDMYKQMSQRTNPYGDGRACEHIVKAISERI